MVPKNSIPGGFAYIAIKTERTQIHFLSDVLIAVASLDLKVPMIIDGVPKTVYAKPC